MAGEAKELSTILSSQLLPLFSSSPLLHLLLLLFLLNNIMTADTTSWERPYWHYRGHKVPTPKEMTSVCACVVGECGGQEPRELEIKRYRNVCSFYDRQVQRKNDGRLRESRETSLEKDE